MLMTLPKMYYGWHNLPQRILNPMTSVSRVSCVPCQEHEMLRYESTSALPDILVVKFVSFSLLTLKQNRKTSGISKLVKPHGFTETCLVTCLGLAVLISLSLGQYGKASV